MYVAEDLGAVTVLMSNRAISAYRAQNHPGVSFEDLRSSYLRRVDIELNLLGTSVLHATAHVYPNGFKRPHQEFSRWHRTNGGHWTFQGGTFDL